MSFDLNTPFKSAADFWNPSFPDVVVKGELRFKPRKGITVKLHHDFSPDAPSIGGPGSSCDLLYGVLVSGPYISVMDGFVTSQEMGAGASGAMKLYAHEVLIGAHVTERDAPAIGSIGIRFVSGEEWLGKRVWEVQHLPTEHETTLRVEGRSQTLFDVPLPAHAFRLKLELFPRSSASMSRYSITGVLSWFLTPAKPISHAEAKALIWKLQILMGLLTGHGAGARLKDVAFEIAPATWDTGSMFHANELYAQRVKESQETLHTHEMLLPHKSCEGFLPELLDNWFTLSERAKSAFNVFISTLIAPPPVQDLRLIALTQALEALHRAMCSGKYMPQEEYDRMLPGMYAAIPAQVDSSHRQSLRSRLLWGNEYSQRKRFRELREIIGPDLASLIEKNAPGFFDRAIETRNYLTHYGDGGRHEIYKDRQLYFAAERLKWFFLVVAFRLLKVPQAAIERAIDESASARHTFGTPL